MSRSLPTGLQFTTLPQRTQERLVDVYFNEDGPLELTKRAASNTTLAKGQSTIKWAQVTSTPPKIQDNRTWWQKLTGQPVGKSNPMLIKARIFAAADGRPDASHAMIPPSTTGPRDNMCLLESYFELPGGLDAKSVPQRGDYVQVDLYNTPGQPPAFKGLSGTREPDGRVVSLGSESGAVNSVIPPNSKGAYAPRGCAGDAPRPNRSASPYNTDSARMRHHRTTHGVGRRSIVTRACATKYNKKSTDLPSTVTGKFPINPITKEKAKDESPAGMLKIPLNDQTDYGPRLHPITRKDQFHAGIDFNYKNTGRNFNGLPVYAALDGKVVDIGDHGKTGYGKYVVIQHGPYYNIDTPKIIFKNTTLFTVYAHLDKASVRLGAGVKQGVEIALSNNSGGSTGAHLHFEVIYHQNKQNYKDFNKLPRTDPMIFLNSRFVRTGKKLP